MKLLLFVVVLFLIVSTVFETNFTFRSLIGVSTSFIVLRFSLAAVRCLFCTGGGGGGGGSSNSSLSRRISSKRRSSDDDAS